MYRDSLIKELPPLPENLGQTIAHDEGNASLNQDEYVHSYDTIDYTGISMD